MVEPSTWNSIIIKSVSIIVSQIHEYAYSRAKATFVANEIIKILPECNLKPLDLLRKKFEEGSSTWSLKQMISVFELFFLLKLKAKDLF